MLESDQIKTIIPFSVELFIEVFGIIIENENDEKDNERVKIFLKSDEIISLKESLFNLFGAVEVARVANVASSKGIYSVVAKCISKNNNHEIIVAFLYTGISSKEECVGTFVLEINPEGAEASVLVKNGLDLDVNIRLIHKSDNSIIQKPAYPSCFRIYDFVNWKIDWLNSQLGSADVSFLGCQY